MEDATSQVNLYIKAKKKKKKRNKSLLVRRLAQKTILT